ncbi:SDR family oxidoreductase [Dickeya sp. ws52]|uniref:SDR family oxidoreductase n=1 Tax=Dickeya sp. ws52 TaxID=2576377 RepID=UPI001181114C|nr:SDR family oxidoreductase [Dickeya sp. ws52]TYL43842.1 SDR family oxidoreductase [Dickeya sp. ws52]
MQQHTKQERDQDAHVAIVTGASRGIGRAIALKLAQQGWRVVVNFARQRQQADEVVSRIHELGGCALAIQAQVEEPEQVAALFLQTKAQFGRIDAVINSAGVMANTPIADGDLAQFDRLIATNLRGAFIVLGEAARQVETGGRIIALSTSVIARSLPSYGPYIASKAGVEGLVRVLANELSGREITVNAVAPGPVATELFFNGKTDAQVAAITAMTPLERLGEPEDIANVVAFLVGPEGGWINGQVVRSNGGFA